MQYEIVMQDINSDIVFAIASWLSDKEAVMFFACNRWLWSHCHRYRYREWYRYNEIRHTSYYDAFTHVVITTQNSLPILPKACSHICLVGAERIPYIDFRREDLQTLQTVELTENFCDISLPETVKTFSIQRYNSKFQLRLPTHLAKLTCEYQFYELKREDLEHLLQLKVVILRNKSSSKPQTLTFGENLTHLSLRQSGKYKSSSKNIPITIPKLKSPNLQHLSIGTCLSCDLSPKLRLPCLTYYENNARTKAKVIERAFPRLETYIGPYRRDLSNLKHLRRLKVTHYDFQEYEYVTYDWNLNFSRLQYLRLKWIEESLNLDLLPALLKLKITFLRAKILNLATSRRLKTLRIKTTEVAIHGVPMSLQCFTIKSSCRLHIQSWPPNLRKLRLYPDNDSDVPALPASLQVLDISNGLYVDLTKRCLPNLRHLTLRNIVSQQTLAFSEFLPADIVTITCHNCDFTVDQMSGFERKIRFYPFLSH